MQKHGKERAAEIMAFIEKVHNAGGYVLAITHLTKTKITKKHVDEGLVRFSKSGNDVIVQRGKRTESLNYCTFKGYA